MTPRQQLVKSAIRRVRSNNWKAEKQAAGETFTFEFCGETYNMVYETITPNSDAMNAVIEDVASRGETMMDYYMGLSDRGYYRLANEIFRKS